MSAENFRKHLSLSIIQNSDEQGEWCNICGQNENGYVVIEEFCTLEDAKKYLAQLVDKMNTGKGYILEQTIEQAGEWYD